MREYQYEPRKPQSRHSLDSVAALIAAYRISPEWSSLKPKTLLHKAIYLRDFEELADFRVVDLKRRTVLAVRDVIASERGHGAANAFLKVTAAVLAWGRERGWIENSPVDRAKRLPGGTLATWTTDEADKATVELSEYLARVVILGRHIGQRRGDLVALSWCDYDGSAVRLTQIKTNVSLVIPVTQTLRAHLDRWKGTSAPTDAILTNRFGERWVDQALSAAMRWGLTKLGMRDELGIHGLRKLAAVILAEAGCTMHEIAAITGHKTLAMVQLYTVAVDQSRLAEAAIARLDRLGSAQEIDELDD